MQSRILALVNDCFETSARLLIDKKPQFFAIGPNELVLDSNKYVANERQEDLDDSIDLHELRQKAMVWFEDDFKFYHAVLEEFRRHLLSSNLHPLHMEACIRKLDDKRSN